MMLGIESTTPSVFLSRTKYMAYIVSKIEPHPNKDAHILIPRNSEYVTLHDIRNVTDMMKFRTLKWGHYSVFSRWVQTTYHKVLIRGEPEGRSQKRLSNEGSRRHRQRQRLEDAMPLALKVEKGPGAQGGGGL